MSSPDSRDWVEFKSWDEVHVGDRLLWIRNGTYGGYTLEFDRYENNFQIFGTPIECPTSEHLSKETPFAHDIYPQGFDHLTYGWVLERRQYKYDPTQAGDLEDDV